jgi:hypothetical protein
MKTIFTFLLLITVLSSYSQKVTNTDQNNGKSASILVADNQSFSISKVYPNPVKDLVTIEIHSELSTPIQMRLINILGTEVKKWEPVNLSQGDQTFKIDLASFKTGVYILKITSSGQVCTQVIKKN